VEKHLSYLRTLDTAIIVSIAGKSVAEFIELARRIGESDGASAIELNVSCPNVSGGVDFGIDPAMCEQVVRGVRQVCELPILAKLTPNVSRIVDVAKAAEAGGADAVCCINTLLGMAIDWRKKKPILGNIVGGLSGPAIKPVALRCVYQVARAIQIPVVGIGGIANIDDVMEFMAAGASAVQIGTANYYDPTVSQRLVQQLPAALAELGVRSAREAVKTF
jgi:dihydroorotate dehydrogenase (NAD+) catalytic subunit